MPFLFALATCFFYFAPTFRFNGAAVGFADRFRLDDGSDLPPRLAVRPVETKAFVDGRSSSFRFSPVRAVERLENLERLGALRRVGERREI